MVERILDWLAAPIVRAQQQRLAQTARAVKRSQRAERRLDAMAEAYRESGEALPR